jgi:hypothetical protein
MLGSATLDLKSDRNLNLVCGDHRVATPRRELDLCLGRAFERNSLVEYRRDRWGQ